MESNVSPTLIDLMAASSARDEAMRIAYEAEGKEHEAAADAAWDQACADYVAAQQAHHMARVANGDNL